MDKIDINKRRNPRVIVKVVIVSSDDETIKMLVDYPDSEAYLYDYSTNLSEGGIFLKTTEEIPVGKPLSMKFTIPNDISLLEATGTVKWVTTEQEALANNISPGVGIEFTHIKEETKQRIRNFIKDIT